MTQTYRLTVSIMLTVAALFLFDLYKFGPSTPDAMPTVPRKADTENASPAKDRNIAICQKFREDKRLKSICAQEKS